MATNLSIDPKLLDRALEVSGEKTKKAPATIRLYQQKDSLTAAFRLVIIVRIPIEISE